MIRRLASGAIVLGAVAASLLAPQASRGTPDQAPAGAARSGNLPSMNAAAERYVRLVLELGHRDADSVDAYYGPPEWKSEAAARARPPEAIRDDAVALAAAVRAMPEAADEMDRVRAASLARQIDSVAARAALLSGAKRTFDQESLALYDAAAPVLPESHFRDLRRQLETELPGPGPLVERYETFRKDFVIPIARLDAVFRTAIAACRQRTIARVALPAEESFRLEYVTDKSWSGYNWYQGGFRSLIQINTDLPITIDRAVDLACHEGYPGHHVYNVLLEKNLVRGRGWIEFQVYPLFSPQSLIAEGSANYGIEVAFPGSERVAFEKTALYPLAGLDPSRAERYGRVRALADRLAYAGNEAARRLVNGEIDAGAAAAWLSEYALMAPARAEQRVRFIRQYRSYVINYNLGKDLVRRWIESRGGTDGNPDVRWKEFERLLSTPTLPSVLAAAPAS